VGDPLGTVSAGGTHHAVAAAHLVDMGHGESSANGARRWSHGVRTVETPLNTITASGATSAVAAAHLITIGYGERTGQDARTQPAEQPANTITAGGIKQAVSTAHLMHMTHHGERRGTTPTEPLPTVTGAHRGEQALVTAHFEQANGGFYAGDGRAATDPLSTITTSGANQQLVTAYFIKYYSSGGQWQDANHPMHTLPTKARMGLVQIIKVPLDALPEEYRRRAKLCADLLREHLPEHFPEPADLVLMGDWALVDITLRMLKPPELFRAQGFPADYVIHEIPDPDLLFVNGRQVAQDPRTLPRIPLTLTAQVRMCGNSVSPKQAEALARANFTHEQGVYAMAA
jgi:DNA (cytosine-5)-methyltransferase 1